MPIPLTVVQLPRGEDGLVACTDCAKCCTYVAVGINAPTTPRYVTDVLWYLYHDKVSVYVDGDGEWCVQFETRCRQLGGDLLCGIYGQRPHICRAFDNESCDVNSREGEAFSFRTPTAFLTWLRERKPRLYERIDRFVLERDRPPPLQRRTQRRRPALATAAASRATKATRARERRRRKRAA